MSEKRNISQHRNTEKELFFSSHDLFVMFFPLVIEQLLNFLVGLIDSIMVAQAGEYAVSGVSLIDNVMILLISFFSAMATGGAVIASQYMGKGEKDRADHAAAQLMKVMLVFSASLMLMVLVFRLFILDVLYGHIEPDVRSAANVYLLIVSCSIPFLGIYHGGAALFRTEGKPKITMYVMGCMNLVNIIGNAILVIGCHMGVVGVAVPTLITRIGAAFWLLVLLNREKQGTVLKIRGWMKESYDLTMIRRIFGIGLPYGFENGIFNLGRLLVLNIVTHFSTASIAANAAGGSIATLIMMPGSAINLGLSVIVSRCAGAGDYGQARYYIRKITKIVQIGLLISSAIVLSFMPVLMDMYHLSAEATHLTWVIIILYAVMINLLWTLSWEFPVIFRAAGDAKYPMIVNIGSMLICRIILAYIFAFSLGFGMLGTWYAMYCDWLLRAVLFLIHYLRGTWTKKNALQ